MSDNILTTGNLLWETWLRPNTRVMCSHMTSEPRALLQSLAHADLPPGLSLELGVPFSMDALCLPDNLPLHVMGGMGTAAALARHRQVVVDRKEYLRFASDYANKASTADVVLISLAAAKDGSLHLGASHGAALDAARHARVVVAEINSAAPVIHGSEWPHDIAITHRVNCHYPVATIQATAGRHEQETAIANHIAEVIPNSACLQVGIGAIPAAVLSALQSHRQLGIHSGMLGDALLQLIQCGAVDNSAKPAGLQKSIVGCVYGAQGLYAAVESLSEIELAHPSRTHSHSILQQIPKFIAINSAIEIDLQGRVNAETAPTADGTRRSVGGIGGLPAFVRGALASQGGQSIIALPALTRYDGTGHSRIVASLDAEITLDESLADIVVTEFGVARLRGATAAQRQQRMLAISSPDARDSLLAQCS